jgi:hypothetical protein
MRRERASAGGTAVRLAGFSRPVLGNLQITETMKLLALSI